MKVEDAQDAEAQIMELYAESAALNELAMAVAHVKEEEETKLPR